MQGAGDELKGLRQQNLQQVLAIFWGESFMDKTGGISWVISHVPMFHITQPLGIWSIMATFLGDVQYSQNGTLNLPTPEFHGIAGIS